MTNENPPQMTVEQCDSCGGTRDTCIGAIIHADRCEAMLNRRLAQQSAATGGEVPKALLAQACVKFGHPANMATDLFVHRNIALAAIEQAMLAATPKPIHPNDMARENERRKVRIVRRCAAIARAYANGQRQMADEVGWDEGLRAGIDTAEHIERSIRALCTANGMQS